MSTKDIDSLIHIRVPAATKGRWVRESRLAGMRLTDWIIQIVEQHMADKMLAQITIPDDVRFSDLHLARDPVQDDLIAETVAEDAAGQHHSLPPGRAQ